MIKLLSSVFLGWSLGSNHSGNAFGTAVASKAIRYRNAIILCSLFIILGAYLGGKNGMITLSKLVNQNINTAFITTLAAAITVTIMTVLKMPISTLPCEPESFLAQLRLPSAAKGLPTAQRVAASAEQGWRLAVRQKKAQVCIRGDFSE